MKFTACKMGDIVNLQQGLCINKKTDYLLAEQGIPLLRITDLINRTEEKFINKDLVPQKFIARPEDMIYTRTGQVGLIFKNRHGIIHNNCFKVWSKTDKVKNAYIYWFLKQRKIYEYVNNIAAGAAQPDLNHDAFKSIDFAFPNKNIQDKIAKVLSNYDDLIENNNKRIKILEEMAQKIYKEWFVDFKFPGLENATIKETTLGNEVMPKKGKNITKVTIKEGKVPVVAGGIEPAYYHNEPNTTAPIITISASGANAGYINLYYQDIWASDCSFIDSSMTPYVYYYYLLLKYNQIKVTNMQRGAAQPHVYPQDLAQLKFNTTNEKIIKEFSIIITPIFEQIKNLLLKNQTLKQTRNILLPRLISGEINVEKMEVL